MRHWLRSFLLWRAGRLRKKADRAARDASATVREWRAEADRLERRANELIPGAAS